MKKSTLHTMLLISLAILLMAGVLAYVGFSSPRVYVDSDMLTVAHTDASLPASTTTTQPTTQQASSEQTTYTGTVHLNSATVEELTSLDGIGEKTALQIISYREKLGGYTSVDQIKNIKGIGDKKFAKIAPRLAL